MNRFTSLFLFLIVVSLVFGCSETPEVPQTPWLIPTQEVFNGGPGKDGIPALQDPGKLPADQVNYYEDGELVIGLKQGQDIRAYPHEILDRHEIINESFDNLDIAITYCPLTGTAIGWNRMLNGKVTTFGVSGLLYNTNLIPYDRETDSNWSQMREECVNGELIGSIAETYMLVETSWGTWKSMYPQTTVVTRSTGFSWPYEIYPYNDYITNHNNILFPISNDDLRLPRKERVLGIRVDGMVRAYQFDIFSEEGGPSGRLIQDNLTGTDVLVAGSETQNFIVAFEQSVDGDILDFNYVENELPVILSDSEGNKWDVFGFAVEGPRIGQRLTPTDSYIGYWFAWSTFNPEIEIYTD